MTNVKRETHKNWDRTLIVENPDAPDRSLLAGTGLDIYEIYSVYHRTSGDWANLRGWFDWLSEAQLRAAIGYALEHIPAMEKRLKQDEEVPTLLEQLWRDYPHSKPPNVR